MNELIVIENMRIEYLVSNEYEQLAEFLSDDLIYVHSAGVVENKQQHIENLQSGFYGYEVFRWLEQSVKEFGELAVVSGKVEWTNWFDKTPQQELQSAAALAVYEKVSDGWLLRNWQTTKLL